MFAQSLLRQFDPQIGLNGLKGIEIKGIREDSRQVQAGDLFVARAGTKTDGRQYVADAVKRGAVAVVTDCRVPECAVPQIIVKDPAGATSRLANILFEQPSEHVKVLGVTGTNGKTTTTYIIRHLLGELKQRCGMIGTVEIDDGRTRREASMTTPSAVEIAELLAAMRNRGCRAAAIEVSSHALDQGRVAGVRFAGAAFTNLTGDHLDYHKTMENYAAAKARLFESLDAGAVAVVNANDEWSEQMIRGCKGRIIRFGIGRKGDYRATNVEISDRGSRFVLNTPDGEAPVRMGLIGRHNIANVLTAAALVGEVYHISVHDIAKALETASGAPGRLQRVPVAEELGFSVFVDYAHTHDGLENVLGAVRPLTRGKLRVLFGCGGDRDRTKRPKMARVAERLADVIYVTSDNPRTEEPGAIIDEILAGFSSGMALCGAEGSKARARKLAKATANRVIVEPDRRAAMERILQEAVEGDVVILAGKGHENYQIIGTEKRHFDDVEEATRALALRQPTVAGV